MYHRRWSSSQARRGRRVRQILPDARGRDDDDRAWRGRRGNRRGNSHTPAGLGLSRPESPPEDRVAFAFALLNYTASLVLVKLKSRALIGGTTIACPGLPSSLALTRTGRPIA